MDAVHVIFLRRQEFRNQGTQRDIVIDQEDRSGMLLRTCALVLQKETLSDHSDAVPSLPHPTGHRYPHKTGSRTGRLTELYKSRRVRSANRRTRSIAPTPRRRTIRTKLRKQRACRAGESFENPASGALS